MKKITFIIAVMMYAITSCGTSIVKEANDYSGKTDDTKLSRTLKLTGFSGIEARACNVRLRYTKSGKYTVKVTATEKCMETIELYVKDGILCIDTKTSGEGGSSFGFKDDCDVMMEVSCPQLRMLKVRSNVEADLSDISSGGDFSIENCGNAKLRAGTIKAGGMKVKNYGNLWLDTDGISGSGDFSIENSGCSELKAKTIKARNVNIRNSGVGKLYTEVIEGAAMHMKQSGHITAKLAFKGNGMEISNSGAGNMSIGVDCSSLMITNSGAASLKVSGTADDVKISGTGVANVDSSGLNKF